MRNQLEYMRDLDKRMLKMTFKGVSQDLMFELDALMSEFRQIDSEHLQDFLSGQ